MIYSSNLIPMLTSNTAPSGIAFASSIYNTTYDAWLAFDGNKTDPYKSWNSAGNTLGYVGYEFPIAIAICKYVITSYNTVDRRFDLTSWTFEGSNNGTTWVILDTKNGMTFTQGESKECTFNNTTNYKKYRVNIYGIVGTLSGTVSPVIQELQMMGKGYTVKYLIQNKSNNKLFTITSGAIVDLGVIALSESVFRTQGMDSINLLSETMLTQIGSCKVLEWNDNPSSSATLKITGNYKDKLCKIIPNYKLKMWTDDTTITTAKLSYTTVPYRPIDKLDNQFKVLMYKE